MDIEKLVPPMLGFPVKDLFELKFLGNQNISQIARYWDELSTKYSDLETELLVISEKEEEDTLEHYHNRHVIENYKKTQEELKGYVDFLISENDHTLDTKPSIASLRPFDWFENGDAIVLFSFIDDNEENINISSGVVIQANGQDTMHYHLDNKDFFNGERSIESVVQVKHPRVMHDWEFGYLLKHPDFAKLYFNSCQDFLPALEEARKTVTLDSWIGIPNTKAEISTERRFFDKNQIRNIEDLEIGSLILIIEDNKYYPYKAIVISLDDKFVEVISNKSYDLNLSTYDLAKYNIIPYSHDYWDTRHYFIKTDTKKHLTKKEASQIIKKRKELPLEEFYVYLNNYEDITRKIRIILKEE